MWKSEGSVKEKKYLYGNGDPDMWMEKGQNKGEGIKQ